MDNLLDSVDLSDRSIYNDLGSGDDYAGRGAARRTDGLWYCKQQLRDEVGSRKSTPSMDNPQKRQSLVYMSPDGGEDGQPGEQILTKYTAIGRPPRSAAQGGEAAQVRYIRSRAATMD
jgi:hypothetical protein